jgi:peptidoglycan/xylan/chitin deacetylase (PgdA/CDA1 family)
MAMFRRLIFRLFLLSCAVALTSWPGGPLAPHVLAQQAPPPVWQWDFPAIKATVDKIRAGRDLTPKKWPMNGRVAVALSFDFDAETLFLRAGQLSPQPESRGEYGARTAMPRILQLLEKQHVPASFFIPVVSAELHPEQVDAILKSPLKHEIGVHGWVHEVLSSLQGNEERDLTKRSFDYWTNRLGHKPTGIRCPSWDFTKDTLPLIHEFGFTYDSSLMADDRPYEIVAEGKPTGIVELPVEWILDDFAYYSYDRPTFAYYRMSDNDVFEVYKGEFDKAYEEGTLFLLTMHPQITGHRSRISVLERLITYMKSKPGVWFATHDQVAQAAKAQLATPVAAPAARR